MSRANFVRFAALALLWGSSFLWIKIALRSFSPGQIALIRVALGCAVLFAIARSRGLRFPRGFTWVHIFVAALIGNAIPYTLFGFGEQSVGSNIAGALNATTPLWAVVVAVVVRTDRTLTARRVAGLMAGCAGTALIFAPWGSADEILSAGGLACLAAAMSYGLSYVYMAKFLARPDESPVVMAASQLGAAAAILAVAAPFGGLTAPGWRVDAAVSLLVLGTLGTGAAYVLNYRLITEEGPAVASTVTYLLPVVAVALGFVALGEPVTLMVAMGIVLVLGGVALSQQPRTKPALRRVGRPIKGV